MQHAKTGQLQTPLGGNAQVPQHFTATPTKPLVVRGRSEFMAGWMAIMPFWLAALPGALAYVLAAHAQGIPGPLILMLSMLAFAGPAQIAALGLLAAGASVPVVILAVAAMNLHFLALGANLARQLRPRGMARLLAAFLMTDAACAVTLARKQPSLKFFAGAGVSMYVVWTVTTGLALLAGEHLALLEVLDLRLVVPVTLIALLTPLLRTRADLAAVLVAGVTMLLLGSTLPAAVAPLIAALLGCVVGYWVARF